MNLIEPRIRIERADRTPRVEQAEEFANNHEDYLQRVSSDETSLHNIMQSEVPVHEENEERSAVASALRYLGVTLRDDPVNHIESTPLQAIYGQKSKQHLVPLFQEATQQFIKGKFEGSRDRARRVETLASGLAGFTPGSAMRAYYDTELRQSSPLIANPELAVIAANVIRQDEDSIRTIEKVNADLIDNPPIVAELSDIQTVGIQQSSTPSAMERRGAGVKISEKLRSNGRYSSEHLFQDAERFQVGLERRMVQLCINELRIMTGTTLITATAVTLDSTSDGEELMEILQAMAKGFIARTVIGRQPAVRTYMTVDRSAFYYASSNQSEQGSAIGSDNYGSATNRQVRDVENNQTNIAADELLIFDSANMIDVYIRNGSDMATEEFINRSRAWEILWDLEFGAAKRHPSTANGRLRVSI